MARETIKARLESMGIGRTTVVNDQVVTRWGADRFEANTIQGREIRNIDDTAWIIGNAK